MSHPAPVNLLDPGFKANPFPFYARIRAEAAVYPTKIEDGRTAYLVTRYDDVVSVLKDPRFIKDKTTLPAEQQAKQPWVPGFVKPLERNMLDVDEPDHRRLRNLVHQVFTPRVVEDMRERVQQIADDLLAKVAASGRMDLVRDYALPLPLTVIAELLGIPEEARPRFHRFSKAMMETTSPVKMLLAIPQFYFMLRHLRALIAERRARPRNDLLTALVQAEEEGSHLSEDELLAMIVLLTVAGHETTVNLIASGTLALLQHPRELERLRQDPTLLKSAIEELLRFTNPVETATERYAREDIELGGVTIPRGELVLVVLASANRDPAQFVDPDKLDLTRDPNRHVAFGQGIHYCLGAPLARLEGQIAIATLLRTLPDLRLDVAPHTLRWRPTYVVRGLEALPVAF
ncbi:cytochrome P450 [Polyangium sp. 6x1]|uniref:cytochrome P450 family protein n=1 Tax=Polyangium sp. 6x1 TaxID=3042689 RepID=UPI0024825D92|nr:cytochrome P450 [Polyangium sp. 6x1]MDI1446114.1 cytochrome P450 [Polyangium sp. 6x1]